MDYYGIIFRSEVGGNAPDGDMFDAAFAQYYNKIHPTYEITVTLTNGTVTGDTTIKDGRTAKITLSADSGYELPALADISITGATIQSYNASTGELVIANPTFNVSIVAACVVESYAITTTVTNGTASGDESIEVGGTASVTVTAGSGYALPSSISVSGASYTYDSTTGVIALSSPTGAVTISVVCEEAASYPVKGDIINIDMNGDGTDEQYLVLKSVGSDNAVEVLARASIGNSKFANNSGQAYAGQVLDNYLNTTYYATLSNAAKAAIIDKEFTQDRWGSGASGDASKNYIGVRSDGSYTIHLVSLNYHSSISRHIYVPRTIDIIDYLGVTPEMTADNTTLTAGNLEAIYHQASTHLCTSYEEQMRFSGGVYYDATVGEYLTLLASSNSYPTFPAFQIDLDKIAWTPSNS